MSSTARDTGEAGQPGSIIPGSPGPGLLPPADPASDEYPVGARAKRDPSNLGDDIPDSGDLVYPTAEPDTNNM